jgi:hypothetical protein
VAGVPHRNRHILTPRSRALGTSVVKSSAELSRPHPSGRREDSQLWLCKQLHVALTVPPNSLNLKVRIMDLQLHIVQTEYKHK